MTLTYESIAMDFPYESRVVLIVAMNDERVIVGSVSVKLKEHDTVAEFARMFVRREVRREGIGRELLVKAETAALLANCKALTCSVAPGNTAAWAFYRRLGFMTAFRFPDGDMLMTKSIGGAS